jgi:hypothetical protein
MAQMPAALSRRRRHLAERKLGPSIGNCQQQSSTAFPHHFLPLVGPGAATFGQPGFNFQPIDFLFHPPISFATHSYLLLKVLLLLFLSLLLLTGISLFFSWLFPAQRLMQPATASNDEWLLEEFTNFQRKSVIKIRFLIHFALVKCWSLPHRFAKAYHSDQERLERFRLFVQNLWQLEERRQLDRRLGVEGRTQWGVTQFFDWSDQEMAQVCPWDGSLDDTRMEFFMFSCCWPPGIRV